MAIDQVSAQVFTNRLGLLLFDLAHAVPSHHGGALRPRDFGRLAVGPWAWRVFGATNGKPKQGAIGKPWKNRRKMEDFYGILWDFMGFTLWFHQTWQWNMPY